MTTRSIILYRRRCQQPAMLCSALREGGEHCELHSLLVNLGDKNTPETTYMEGTA